MAAIECRCGNRLSDNSVPSDIIVHQFSDGKMDEILRQDYISTIELYKASEKIWKCPICHRFYSFDSDGKILDVYTKESA